MNKDTIVHGSIVTPSVKLVGACTVLDSVLRGDITVNPRAVLQGVEIDGRGTFYGRVVLVPYSAGQLEDRVSDVHVGPGVRIGSGVRVMGHGEIRGVMTIERIEATRGTYIDRSFEGAKARTEAYDEQNDDDDDEPDPNLQDDWEAP